MPGGRIAEQKLTAIIEEEIKILMGVFPVPDSVMERFRDNPFIDSHETDKTLQKLQTVIDTDLRDDAGRAVKHSFAINKVDDFVLENMKDRIPVLKANERCIKYLSDLQGELTDPDFNVIQNELLSLLQPENAKERQLLELFLEVMIGHLTENRFAEYLELINPK